MNLLYFGLSFLSQKYDISLSPFTINIKLVSPFGLENFNSDDILNIIN